MNEQVSLSHKKDPLTDLHLSQVPYFTACALMSATKMLWPWLLRAFPSGPFQVFKSQ